MPNETKYTGNYIGKTLNDIGLTQQLETTASAGINSKTILGVADKYQIDLYGSLQTHRPEETPMLTIMESMGSESVNAPYFIWTDEYTGNSWWDINFDNLRLRNSVGGSATISPSMSGFTASYNSNTLSMAMTNPSYTGGQIKIRPIRAIAATNINTVVDNTIGNDDGVAAMTLFTDNFMYGQAFVPTSGQTGKVMFAILEEDSNTVGQMVVTWNKIRNLLVNLGYTEINYKNTSNDTSHEAGTVLRCYSDPNLVFTATLPAYMVFPNISFNIDGTIYKEEQVLARVNSVAYTSIGGYNGVARTGTMGLVFTIDFNDCNAQPGSLGAYATGGSPNYDSVMIGQPFIKGVPAAGTAVFGDNANDAAEYAGSVGRMLYIGQAQSAAYPIPEGDKFRAGGNLAFGREQKMNLTQIFVSPAYGITGTHQASTFRFGDDFQRTRDFHFTNYKKYMQGTFMYGTKGETIATSNDAAYGNFVSGQPVRATGGFMDYALFPIRHMKHPLTSYSWTDDVSSVTSVGTFIDWLDQLADSLAAFRQQSSKSLTLLCSQVMCNRLNRLVRGVLSTPQLMGGTVVMQPASDLSFGLPYYEFMSSGGVMVKFIHDPGMDNTPSINLPFWIYGKSQISPRDLLISIDPKNIKRMVLRPDKIYGNVQDIGQDAFMEAIRGESGFMLRFPQNHAVIYAPTA